MGTTKTNHISGEPLMAMSIAEAIAAATQGVTGSSSTVTAVQSETLKTSSKSGAFGADC